MKRPGGAARKTLPLGGTADATKKKAKKNHASSNLLGNILGNIKKTSEQQLQQQQQHRASNGKMDGKPLPRIERSSLMTPQERALERRKKFEKDIKEKIEKEVVEKWTASEGKETASFSFQPMQKMWRDVAHGCASEMQTTSESIEIDNMVDENGDPMKFVRVYKLSKKEEEEKKQLEISLREKAEKTKREMLAFRKKESLTDKAPAFGDDVSELRVAREGEKRDKRSVEETIADMRKAKEC